MLSEAFPAVRLLRAKVRQGHDPRLPANLTVAEVLDLLDQFDRRQFRWHYLTIEDFARITDDEFKEAMRGAFRSKKRGSEVPVEVGEEYVVAMLADFRSSPLSFCEGFSKIDVTLALADVALTRRP